MRSLSRRPWLTTGALAMAAGLLLLACAGGAPPGSVHVSELDGDIGPVAANFIDRALDRAEDHAAAVWILELDTPGGLGSAMDDIVQRIEAARLPVVVFVSPLGARAASAGTFITLAAHLAAMAPSTQIGAAHPVGGGGEEIEGSLGDKVTNDAAADIRGIADLRGRNADWAERAVRESVSATATEALDLGVIDLIANDLPDLLTKIDGRSVTLTPGTAPVTIQTAGARIVRTDLNLYEQVLDFIADPNIAFLLISLGGLALLIELFSPGLVGPGLFGVIMLALGFFAVGVLDTNPAGIALLVLAFILFAVEIFVPGFGVFGIAGLVSLVLGGLLLMSDAPDAPAVSLWLLGVVAAVVGGAFFGLGLLILRDRRRRRPHVSLAARIVGHHGVVRTALDPRGTILVDSEVWTARTDGPPLGPGTRIEVLSVEELCAVVRPRAEEAGPAHPAAPAAGGPPPPMAL